MPDTSHFGARLVLLALLASSAAAAAPRYHCEVLPGAVLRRQNAFSESINNPGEIVGYGQYSAKDSALAAVRWKADNTREILSKSRHGSTARGINDAGQVAGDVSLRDGVTLPVVWTDGVPTPLRPLMGREGTGVAQAINNRGQVVGASSMPVGGQRYVPRATLWNHGHAIDMGALNDQYESRAMAINDDGVAVGWNQVGASIHHIRALRWSWGRPVEDLGTLPGGRRAWAFGINRAGVVVGKSHFAGGGLFDHHATAWKNGGVIDPGALPGKPESAAYAINAAGDAVGYSREPLGEMAAAVWLGTQAEPIDLNQHLDEKGCVSESGRRLSLSYARGINDQGVIAATSYYATPGDHPQSVTFRLTPY